MGRVLILSPMEAIPCNATCAPPDSLASHGRAYVLGSKPSSPLRGDITVSPTHALPIIHTALVSPACPPAGIGQQGTSLTGGLVVSPTPASQSLIWPKRWKEPQIVGLSKGFSRVESWLSNSPPPHCHLCALIGSRKRMMDGHFSFALQTLPRLSPQQLEPGFSFRARMFVSLYLRVG